MNKINVIITGATGMVGEGVLHECLHSDEVASVLIINRKPLGMKHPKLKEIIHADFYDITALEGQLSGYDACFFCLGISSVGLPKEEYEKITYTLTMHVAEVLLRQNPDMVFNYVSGASTDSTEKGRVHWARVKGKTENELMAFGFKKVYAFRPGFMLPTPGMKNTNPYYKYISWLYPVLKKVAPNSASTLAELGLAMIHSVTKGYEKQILEVKDIIRLAHT